MWTYRQTSGILERDGLIVGVGYSGAPAGKNIPSMQAVPCVGPIPQGMYLIGEPEDSQAHGPHAMHLLPSASNKMFGRSGFLLHGDSKEHPGCASEGCIIMSRDVRDKVSASEDRYLQVTA